MRRAKFPSGVPVFEIVTDKGEFAPRGTIVEGTEIGGSGYDMLGRYYVGWDIGVRVPDESQLRFVMPSWL